MYFSNPQQRVPGRVRRRRVIAFLLSLGFLFSCISSLSHTQGRASIDLARQAITEVPAGMNSTNISIHNVSLGMSWGEARTILDQMNVPYIFQKGTSPVVYIPPQNSTYYMILNPSSYDVIEMGIIGVSDLILDNQFLFDAQRWRLTTARTQFFGNEGEFIINEEGESYNFPYLGFVLKYLTPGNFRFVMVAPTNKPLTTYGQKLRPEGIGAQPAASIPASIPPPSPAPLTEGLDYWLGEFQQAREHFENKRYSSALAGFRRITENSPDPLLRVRSIYWMGEAYYGLKQYKNAKKQFERVVDETDIETLREPARLMIKKCNKFIR